MDPQTFIGTLGTVTILIAFTLNQTHKLDRDSFIYDGMNFVGSALLVAYAVAISSYPFVVLNLIWATVSLRDLTSKKKEKN